MSTPCQQAPEKPRLIRLPEVSARKLMVQWWADSLDELHRSTKEKYFTFLNLTRGGLRKIPVA